MIFKVADVTIFLLVIIKVYSQSCDYGARGSRTTFCTEATPETFKTTSYKFNHYDETVKCLNCSLTLLNSGTFNITFNRIKYLDISNSKIFELRKSAFEGLNYLHQLNMEHNNIQRLSSGTFKGLKKLKNLYLAHNNISILELHCFDDLESLEYLDISFNILPKIGFYHLRDFNNLKTVNFSHNLITSYAGTRNLFGSLKTLDLSFNQIGTSLCCDIFKEMPGLIYLHLSYNKIEDIDKDAFLKQNDLEVLDLSFNPISTMEKYAFRGLINLKALNMENCSLNEINELGFFGLHSLKTLNLAYNKLEKFEISKFTDMSELRELNISSNELKVVVFNGFLKMNSLRVLDISGNELTYFNYSKINKYAPDLDYIYIKFNNFSCYLRKSMKKYFSASGLIFEVSHDTYTDSNCNASDISFIEYEDFELNQETLTKIKDLEIKANLNDAGDSVVSDAFYFFAAVILISTIIFIYLKYRKKITNADEKMNEEIDAPAEASLLEM